MLALRATVALVLCALACGLPAQAAPCRTCDGAGLVPCSKHGKLLAAEQAPHVLHCSIAAACKACGGALALACRQCRADGAAAELARRQELARQWLQRRRAAVDALVQREPFLHLATTHADVVSLLQPLTVGTQKLDQHQLLHLYGDRIEALRTTFRDTLQLDDADLPERLHVLLSDQAKDHAILGPRLTGMGSSHSTGLKLMGPEYVYSMWHDRRSLPDDEAVHRNVVHHVTHLLLSQMPPAQWLGNRKHGWVDEGVAHWFEDKVVGRCTNFCHEEVGMLPGAGFAGGRWRPAVRKLVDEGKAPSFAALSAQNSDELTFAEHAFAFATVDFLLSMHGGGRFRDFVRLLKGGTATRDALPQVYGLSPLSIDAAFVTWVKANYSPLVSR